MTPAIIIAIIVILAAWYLSTRQSAMERRLSKISDRITLPSGLQVWREEGAPFILTTAAEAAMIEVFEQAALKGYSHKLTLDQYVLAVIRADERSEDGLPAFKVSDKGYQDTVFDKGDYVLAAGQFMEPNIILIPYHAETEICALKDIVKHEMIHAVLFWNDKQKYDASCIHNEVPFEL